MSPSESWEICMGAVGHLQRKEARLRLVEQKCKEKMGPWPPNRDPQAGLRREGVSVTLDPCYPLASLESLGKHGKVRMLPAGEEK